MVGLSATLPNAAALAAWLGAAHHAAHKRPRPLIKRIAVGRAVFDAAWRRTATIEAPSSTAAHSTLPCLVQDAVARGGQALVFLQSRRGCDEAAAAVAAFLRASGCAHLGDRGSRPVRVEAGRSPTDPDVPAPPPASPPAAGPDLQDTLDARARLCEALAAAGVPEPVRRCVEAGVAVHHAGLDEESRVRIEAAYRRQVIHTLCATTTLAAGVNLPAQRVIICNPFRRGRLLPAQELHQMAGRAGRVGHALAAWPAGQCFLALARDDPPTRRQVASLLTAPLPAAESTLSHHGTAALLLDALSTGLARSPADADRYALATLFAAQRGPDAVRQSVAGAQRILRALSCLSPQPDALVATPFGRSLATINVDIISGLILYQELQSAKHRLVTAEPLHVRAAAGAVRCAACLPSASASHLSSRVPRTTALLPVLAHIPWRARVHVRSPVRARHRP